MGPTMDGKEKKMIARIDHVSLAVKDQAKAERFFRDILGAVPGAGAADPATQFFWQLFSLGDLSRLEVISPTGPDSFLNGFLQSRESGVHHITLQTPDIRKAMDHLKAHDIPFFGYNKYPGGVWTEIFIHPRHAFGVLIQIAQFEADDWLSEKVKFPAGTGWEIRKTGDGAELTFAHPGGGKVAFRLEQKELQRLVTELQQAL